MRIVNQPDDVIPWVSHFSHLDTTADIFRRFIFGSSQLHKAGDLAVDVDYTSSRIFMHWLN